jgi:RHS repeat-associated protein
MQADPVSGPYALDADGNRTKVTTSGGVTSYTYDALNRLTSWTNPASQITQYAYDPVGNRLSIVAPSGTTTYAYDAADEMLTAGTTTFTYDGNGNQRTKTTGASTLTYAWDALNRLVAVTGGAANTTYQYDGDGKRLAQQAGAQSYQYVNDTTASLPVVLNENGPDGNIDYLYGRQMISATSPAFKNYYQYDGLGSTSVITGSTGAGKEAYTYDPWGTLLNASDALGTKNKYKFTGEAFDSNTELLYLRARYYDPTLGRFLSRDPLQGVPTEPQSLRGYQYALNNPVLLTDPSGKIVPILAVLAIGATAGAITGGVEYWATAGNNFTPQGFWSSVGIGAVAGTAATGAGLLTAAALTAAGISVVAAAVVGGGVAGGVGQVTTNALTGRPPTENMGSAIALGGALGGIPVRLPDLMFRGSAPSYTLGLNPGYFGPNSARVLGQEFLSDTLSSVIALGSCQY